MKPSKMCVLMLTSQCPALTWSYCCAVPDPQVLTGVAYKVYYIDHLVEGFMNHFNRYYADALATDFNSLPLTDQVDYVKLLYRVHSYLLPMKSQAFTIVILIYLFLLLYSMTNGPKKMFCIPRSSNTQVCYHIHVNTMHSYNIEQCLRYMYTSQTRTLYVNQPPNSTLESLSLASSCS